MFFPLAKVVEFDHFKNLLYKYFKVERNKREKSECITQPLKFY